MPLTRSSSFSNVLGGMLKDSSHSRRSNHTSSSTTYHASGSNIVEFSLVDFEDFLTQSLSTEVEREIYTELSQCLDEDDLRETFQSVEIGLLSLLESHSTLPATIMGDIYSYLGLVYLEQDKKASAVDAFTKAIWFQSRTGTDNDTFAIAQANHRLGMALGRKGEYKKALATLDRAIDAYDSSSELFVMAKEDRHSFQEAHLLDLLAKTRPEAIHRNVQPSSPSSTTPKKRTTRRRILRSGSNDENNNPTNSPNTNRRRKASRSPKKVPRRNISSSKLGEMLLGPLKRTSSSRGAGLMTSSSSSAEGMTRCRSDSNLRKTV